MDFNYDDDKIEALMLAIYTGIVSAYQLPKNLYLETAFALRQALYAGYGGRLIDFTIGSADYELLYQLRTNIFMFSGAKTFTQVKYLTSMMYEGTRLLGLDEYKEKAKNRFKVYNGKDGYIESEYITAQTSGTSAINWNQAKGSKKFVQLKAIAIIDENTSPICEKVNGTVLPIDHPFWNTHKSPRHWRCRCHEEIIDIYEQEPETPNYKIQGIEEFTGDKMQRMFKMNPGKDKVVFKTKGPGKHPYFDIEPKYKSFAKVNFNLPIPERD